MMADHDQFCPCFRLGAADDFCNCGAATIASRQSLNPAMLLGRPTATGWRRKRGLERQPGWRTLNRHTPKNVHKFATTRVSDVGKLLQEIEILYGDVDETIVAFCAEIREHDLPDLQAYIDERFKSDLELEGEPL